METIPQIDSMFVAEGFVLAVVLSAITGFRVIGGLLGMAVLSKFGMFSLPAEFAFLSSTIILWIIGLAALIEAAADLSDTVALTIDSIASPLRSGVGSFVGMSAMAGVAFENQEMAGFADLLAQPEMLMLIAGSGILSGGASYGSSTGKKWFRRASSVVIPFFGGKVTSSAETVGGICLVAIAYANPWIALGLVILGAITMGIFLYLFYKTARFAYRKVKKGMEMAQGKVEELQATEA